VSTRAAVRSTSMVSTGSGWMTPERTISCWHIDVFDWCTWRGYSHYRGLSTLSRVGGGGPFPTLVVTWSLWVGWFRVVFMDTFEKALVKCCEFRFRCSSGQDCNFSRSHASVEHGWMCRSGWTATSSSCGDARSSQGFLNASIAIRKRFGQCIVFASNAYLSVIIQTRQTSLLAIGFLGGFLLHAIIHH